MANEWKPVSFAADCTFTTEPEPGDDSDDLGDLCSICGLDYCDECKCPGPTQDEVEYKEVDGVLMGRFYEDHYEP